MKLTNLLCRVCLIFAFLLVVSCIKDKDTEPAKITRQFLTGTVWTAKRYSLGKDQSFELVETHNIYFRYEDKFEVDMLTMRPYSIDKDVFYIFGTDHLIIPISQDQFELRQLESGVSLEPTPTNKYGYRHKIVFTRKGGHR